VFLGLGVYLWKKGASKRKKPQEGEN